MAQQSVLPIKPSWIHQDDPSVFTDYDLFTSLDCYLRSLKSSFAILADHLDEQGAELGALFAFTGERQVNEATELLNYWQETKQKSGGAP